MGRFAMQLGKLGSALGILVGLIEICVGAQILPWIGNKENPVVLGIITVFLSAISYVSVHSARKHIKSTTDYKLVIFLGILLPAVICFTTVGRLWYLPGPLLIVTCLLLGYEYCFGQSKASHIKIISRKFDINQITGSVGSLIILISIGLGFFNSNFALLQPEVFVNADYFRLEILPMDIVRLTNLSGSMIIVEDVEVRLVMIVYILLILGAAISLISSLVESKMVTRIGVSLVFTALALFPTCFTAILEQVGVSPMRFQNIIGLLGICWYLALAGMLLILISLILKGSDPKGSNPNIKQHLPTGSLL